MGEGQEGRETEVAQRRTTLGRGGVGGGAQRTWLHAVAVTGQLRSQGFPELVSVKSLLTERPFLWLYLVENNVCEEWAFSSEAAVGAGV